MSQPLTTLLVAGASTSQSDRAHRLLVAQRLAEAVDAVHAAGGVIGTLDTQRVLVEPDGMVTLSDEAGVATIARTPAYTAPELQGSFPGHTRPEAQHDAFALAVLLFQLLMAGNHPYAGQWVGGGNLPDIPKAIQLGLYAYGGSSVTPPPDAPALSTLEPGLADLFKRSFGATSAIFRNRPTGAEWARALAAVRLAHLNAPALQEPAAAAVTPEPPAPAMAPDLVPQRRDQVTVPPGPLPGHEAEPEAHSSVSEQMTESVAAATSQAHPQVAPEAASPNPSMQSQEPRLPVPATSPDLARRPRARTWASPAKRTVSRPAIPPRAVRPDGNSREPLAAAPSDTSWSSYWNAVISDLLYEMAVWKQAILLFFGFLLFLIVFVLAERNDYWANPGARPAKERATRVPATETSQPRPTATRSAPVAPRVASFGDNFDGRQGSVTYSGADFTAEVVERNLQLDVLRVGGRGQVVFNHAQATRDFNFTVHVASYAGDGEIVLVLTEPAANRIWSFTIDPATQTWRIFRENLDGSSYMPALFRQRYASVVPSRDLRTITLARQADVITLAVNGTVVSDGVRTEMPGITSPVIVGVGASINPSRASSTNASFTVIIGRVALHADEAA